jgi:predicted signal transduction protein with EAL and GGDEF domain
VAEGVEHAAQAARLRELGCRFGQGYLFGRPASAEEAERLLHRRESVRNTQLSCEPAILSQSTIAAQIPQKGEA